MTKEEEELKECTFQPNLAISPRGAGFKGDTSTHQLSGRSS